MPSKKYVTVRKTLLNVNKTLENQQIRKPCKESRLSFIFLHWKPKTKYTNGKTSWICYIYAKLHYSVKKLGNSIPR